MLEFIRRKQRTRQLNFLASNRSQGSTKLRRRSIAIILLLSVFSSPVLSTGSFALMVKPKEPVFNDGNGNMTGKPCSTGTIDGSADVNCTGAGTYTVPLDMPPGSNGVQPSLTLKYNS